MDTYTVLESNGKPVGDNPKRVSEIKQVLGKHLQSGHRTMSLARLRRSRKAQYFSKPIEIGFLSTEGKPYSTLEVNCPDQPGILACVGKVFAENDVNLQDARITTLGERVEDLFFITDKNGQPLSDETFRTNLAQQIKSELEDRLAS